MDETELLERIPEQGLTIGEQAALLWTACRYASMENHAACPVELLRDLDGCPFGDKDCENLPFHAWDTFLRERDTGKVFSDQGK